jgi:hypothetical protein
VSSEEASGPRRAEPERNEAGSGRNDLGQSGGWGRCRLG